MMVPRPRSLRGGGRTLGLEAVEGLPAALAVSTDLKVQVDAVVSRPLLPAAAAGIGGGDEIEARGEGAVPEARETTT